MKIRTIRIIGVLIVAVLLLTDFVIAQNQIKTDSLKQVISKHKKNDTIQIENLLKLGDQYEYFNQDTAIYYYLKAFAIAENINEKKFASKCLNYLGIIYESFGDYPKSIEAYLLALRINTEIDNKVCIGKNLINLGVVYESKTDYTKALEYYQEALKINEKFGSKYILAINYVDIGLLNKELGNFSKALDYFNSALLINEEIGEKRNSAITIGNIATIYDEQEDLELALKYYQKSLETFEEIGFKSGIANSFINIGSLYTKQGHYSKSLDFYKKALKISKEIDDKNSISASLGKIALLYNRTGDFDTAIKYAKESLDISKKIGSLKWQKFAYKHLSDAYQGVGNYKTALEYKDLWIDIKDSIFNTEKIKTIADIQTRYENEKYEKQIIQQKAELEKQKTQRDTLIIAFVLMIIFALIVLSLYRQKRTANILLAKQKNKIEATNLILEEQKHELEQANATKNKFFSIIAHDMLSPFNAILGVSRILLEDHTEINNKERHYLIEAVLNSSESAYELFENLLEWSKTQTDNIILHPKTYDINLLLSGPISYIKNSAKEKNIEIINTVNTVFTLFVDIDMLRTILRNLNSNAVKFTPEGGKITIGAWQTETETFFSVGDSGVGMSIEKQKIIFDITKKTNTLGTNRERGTGLGLILCKEFVEKHGGKLWVESEVNKGSKFIFNIPKDLKKG